MIRRRLSISPMLTGNGDNAAEVNVHLKAVFHGGFSSPCECLSPLNSCLTGSPSLSPAGISRISFAPSSSNLVSIASISYLLCSSSSSTFCPIYICGFSLSSTISLAAWCATIISFFRRRRFRITQQEPRPIVKSKTRTVIATTRPMMTLVVSPVFVDARWVCCEGEEFVVGVSCDGDVNCEFGDEVSVAVGWNVNDDRGTIEEDGVCDKLSCIDSVVPHELGAAKILQDGEPTKEAIDESINAELRVPDSPLAKVNGVRSELLTVSLNSASSNWMYVYAVHTKLVVGSCGLRDHVSWERMSFGLKSSLLKGSAIVCGIEGAVRVDIEAICLDPAFANSFCTCLSY